MVGAWLSYPRHTPIKDVTRKKQRVVDKKSRKTQSMFVCTACGVEIHADVNAAKNILDAGLAVVMRGESAIEVDPEKRKNSEPLRAA